MSVFAYNPESAKAWADKVLSYLNGDTSSIYSCSKRFDENVKKLVQPNVWTGAAASKNYQNFMETHQALINFTNSFGNVFGESMNSVNKNIAQLEVDNLGVDTNVSSFGDLSYSQIAQLSEENINKQEVRYDYGTISEIGESLKEIRGTLEDVTKNLKTKLSELNSGEGIWDGDAAGSAKESLLNVVDSNMSKVSESLEICISNIANAAAAAQMADRG